MFDKTKASEFTGLEEYCTALLTQMYKSCLPSNTQSQICAKMSKSLLQHDLQGNVMKVMRCTLLGSGSDYITLLGKFDRL